MCVLGVSMGAAYGVIYATLLQDTFKTAILLDGGYFLNDPPTGADHADFAPFLKRPVLMVNGRYDFTFSLEPSQEPPFRMLGIPPTHGPSFSNRRKMSTSAARRSSTHT